MSRILNGSLVWDCRAWLDFATRQAKSALHPTAKRTKGTSLTIHFIDFRLVDTTFSGQYPLAKSAKLSVRALVRPNLIPLVGFTGPTLEVNTDEDSTAEWIRDKLLNGCGSDQLDQGTNRITGQCPIGILLNVDDRSGSPEVTNPHHVSDILIYGTLVPSSSPSTPSSQADGQFEGNSSDKELLLSAATLCPGLITKAQSLPSPPNSPEIDADAQTEKHVEFAEFLPDLRSPSPKRKRVATLFEAATEYHKKIRRKGPAAMSEYLSREKSATPHFPPPPSMLKVKKEVDSQINLGAIPAEDSQPKPHVMSIRKKNPGPLSRPSSSRSRSMSVSNGKNTQDTLGNHSRPSSQGQMRGQEPQHATADGAIATNKALLTRTILTCMRLYGFHRTSGRTGSQAQAPTLANPVLPTPIILAPANNEFRIQETEDGEGRLMTPSVPASVASVKGRNRNADTSKEDVGIVKTLEDDNESEFKEMYHATYRASSFALRRFLKASPTDVILDASASPFVPILTKDKVMDTVDSVLKLFCEGSDL